MYKFTFICTLCFMLFGTQSFCQVNFLDFRSTFPVNNTDSLYLKLNDNYLKDTERLKTLIKLERSLFWTFSTRSVLPEIYNLSKSINENTGLIFYYSLNALMYASINKFEESAMMLAKANQLLPLVNDKALLIFVENIMVLTQLTQEVKKETKVILRV